MIPNEENIKRHYKVWDEITCPFGNSNSACFEVWQGISIFIPDFNGHVITYPCWFKVNPYLHKKLLKIEEYNVSSFLSFLDHHGLLQTWRKHGLLSTKWLSNVEAPLTLTTSRTLLTCSYSPKKNRTEERRKCRVNTGAGVQFKGFLSFNYRMT